jgi:hypothetical protein
MEVSHMARWSFGVPLILLLVSVASAQNPPQNDPQALNLVAQSIAALTGGTVITDATLSGTAVWTVAPSSENANATLLAKGTGESRFDMALSEGQRSEIRNDGSPSNALGEVLASDGSILQWGFQDTLINAVWFFPQLSVLGVTGDPNLIFSYIGQESRNGAPVQHIQSYRYSSTNTASVQQWSTMDMYLDATSLLPVAFAFNIYSTDGSQVIQAEVDFSNYQVVSGVQVPFRIQRHVAGNLGLDFSVTGAQFNSGLQDSLFAIQ